MVVCEYNRPAQYNRIALFRLKIKAFDVRTTKMKNFFVRVLHGCISYWLNDGIIRHWVGLFNHHSSNP